MALLRREAALWAMTEAPPEESRPAFERVFAESAKLINPWTVELSRESRWEGFRSFCANYTDCSVDITHLTLDNERPSLFAVERKFRCTNRETGVRGVDEDWAVGEVVAGEGGGLRLRFCRVYFGIPTPRSPQFLGRFAPVLRRASAVLLCFLASWRQDGENGRKMAENGRNLGEKRARNSGG